MRRTINPVDGDDAEAETATDDANVADMRKEYDARKGAPARETPGYLEASIVELQAAIEASRQATARVAELRKLVIDADMPREWTFSHDHYSTRRRDEGGRFEFATLLTRRAEVEAKLREAIRALPLDRSQESIDIRASATCDLTGETVEAYVHVQQDEPECVRLEGHEWIALYKQQGLHSDELPYGRRLTDGCPHCDGQRLRLTPDVRKPSSEEEVSYEAPHHYAEGFVRQTLEQRQRLEQQEAKAAASAPEGSL